MSMVEGGSVMATVDEMAMLAGEETDDGRGGRQLCSVFFYSNFFLTVTAADTDCRGNGPVSSCKVVCFGMVINAVIVANYVAIIVYIAVTITAAVPSSTGPFS
jgi:hypothetical protein